jgi:hypothetical protein
VWGGYKLSSIPDGQGIKEHMWNSEGLDSLYFLGNLGPAGMDLCFTST